MPNILDMVARRGKRKDAIVGCPGSFLPGLKVRFGRFRKRPERGYEDVGGATVESVDIRGRIVKFDALPLGVKAGDVILLNSTMPPREEFIHAVRF